MQVVFGIITALTFFLGVLALFLPIERTLRLPAVAFTLELFPSWCWLIAGDAVAKVSGFLDVIYLTWMLIAGYSEVQVASFFFCVAGIGALVTLLFCVLLFTIHGYGKPLTVVTSIFMFPPSFLGSLAALSAPRLTTTLIPIFLGVAIVLTTVKRMATSLLKVYAMPSRWKYVTFQSYGALFLSGCEAVSPFLMHALSKCLDLDISVKGTVYSDVLARSNFLLSVIFSILHFAIGLITIRHLKAEGIFLWFPPPCVPPLWPPLPEMQVEAPPVSKATITTASAAPQETFIQPASVETTSRASTNEKQAICNGAFMLPINEASKPPPPSELPSDPSLMQQIKPPQGNFSIAVVNRPSGTSATSTPRHASGSYLWPIRRAFEYIFKPAGPSACVIRHETSSSLERRFPRWLRSTSSDSAAASDDTPRSAGSASAASISSSEPGWLRQAGELIGIFEAKAPPLRNDVNTTLASLAAGNRMDQLQTLSATEDLQI